MAVNNRIFYACQAVGIKRCSKTDVDTTPITVVHGVQSVGTNTSFNIENIFELGMVQTYEAIEGLAEVEVTLEKVLDGYPLMYHLSSPQPESAGITGRSKEQCCVVMGIYSDANDVVSGQAPVEMYCSGMYLGSISYSIPVDGNATESITFQGNEKSWNNAGYWFSGGLQVENAYQINADGTGGDYPLSLDTFDGGVQRRENVLISQSIFPKSVFGVDNDDDVGNAYDIPSSSPKVHFQNVNISTDTSREDILELGRRSPYYRAASYPIEVTCELEAIAISGDQVFAWENGNPLYIGSADEGNNTANDKIEIVLKDGTVFDLGSRNKLSSVSYGGGDATGGNATMTYSYTNYNDFRILHPQDPASGYVPPGKTAPIYLAADIAKVNRGLNN